MKYLRTLSICILLFVCSLTQAKGFNANFKTSKEAEILAYGLTKMKKSFYGVNGRYGYVYKNCLFLGAGVGFEYLYTSNFNNGNNESNIRIPVFIAPKYTFHLEENTTLHIQIDAGIRIYTKSKSDFENLFFYTPKVGIGFRTGNKSFLNVSIGFSNNKKLDLQYTGLHIGISF